MKVNVFRIENDKVGELTVELEDNGFECEADNEDNNSYSALYLRKKHAQNRGWLEYYQQLLSKEKFAYYTENISSESVSGLFLIQKNDYSYAFSYGQTHFVVRKYCDKDFGLNLAERILNPQGLKMKHSQTFTSAGKKDITSYLQNRKLDDSRDYGEAFSYVKCKTIDKELWGESADFGESARFSLGKNFHLSPLELYRFTDEIEKALKAEVNIKLPRYHKVIDKNVLDSLNEELDKHFGDFVMDVDVSDYWLTGVSFNFSNDYRYSLKLSKTDLSDISDTLDINYIRETISDNKEKIKGKYNSIRVIFYNENDEALFSKKLKELLQITVEFNGKYYVFFQNEWVEFSESYVKFIQEQVDSINFHIKQSTNQTETELIDSLVASGKYTQLHKDNVYINGKYCIEKADLMDDESVIMIKDQHQQADLVYLVKQATTSLRLANAGEIGENVFNGRSVCLWMLVNRKRLTRLSDFKSFHLLDALNDFKKAVVALNLTPKIWISLGK